MHPSTHIAVRDVSVSFGQHRVLSRVSFTAPTGKVTGIIGENGSGKSTLLRVMAGLLKPDAGHVESSGTVGLLHQEVPFSLQDTISQVVSDAIAPALHALDRMEVAAHSLKDNDVSSQKEYADALDEAERRDAWNVTSLAEEMLVGLGLQNLDRNCATERLSGGERARLSLVWLLLRKPDVLLLDEPTNHLDARAVAYLVEVLQRWRGPVVMASHDRAFLDECARFLVDLDPVASRLEEDVIQTFSGTYSDYVIHRLDATERWHRQYREQQNTLRKARAAVRDSTKVGHPGAPPRTESKIAKKFYADRAATVATRRLGSSRMRLERVEKEQIRKPPSELRFCGIPDPQDSPNTLSLRDVSVPGRLGPVSQTFGPGEKWLVTGVNGSGKSTLLQVLAGALKHEGVANIDPRHTGLLSQEPSISALLTRGKDTTAQEAFEDLSEVGASLTGFGLVPPRELHRPVRLLSVGTRRRLELALLVAAPPPILLLDEPTNHISLVLATELEDAVSTYAGTTIVATHDRWLIDRWPGKRLHLS